MKRDSTRRSILAGIAGATVVPVVAGASSIDSEDEETWGTNVGSGDDVDLRDVVALDTGDTIVLGQNGSHPLVARLDRNGTAKWDKTIRNDEYAGGQFVAGAPRPDEGAVLIGYSHVADGEYVRRVNVRIVTIDGRGTVTSQSTIENGDIRIADVVPDGDGSVAVGEIPSDEEDRDVVLFGLDAEGNERWRTRAEVQFEGVQSTGVARSQTGYCVVGKAWHQEIRGDRRAPAFALGFDTEGDNQWRTTYDSAEVTALNDVGSDCDGGFVIVGTTHPDDINVHGLVFQVDSDGTEGWREVLTDQGINNISHIELRSDGFVSTAASLADGRDTEYELKLAGIEPGGGIWFQRTLQQLPSAHTVVGLACPTSDRATMVLSSFVEVNNQESITRYDDTAFGATTPSRTEDALHCARLSDTSQSSPSDFPLSGFGAGVALGGFGLGAGLLEARRRRSGKD